jgi:hypothetical protein
MQINTIAFFLLISLTINAQELQLNYDFRYSIDPDLNKRNFPTLFFKYFKSDTAGRGSTLIQIQSMLNGRQANIGETFVQISQSLRFWKPEVFLALNYSGGLGTTDDSYGFHIENSYGIGVSKNFIYPRIWISTGLLYRADHRFRGNNAQLNLFIGGGLFNFKLMYSGSLVFLTRDTVVGRKKVSFFGDPQLWYGIGHNYAVGTRINVYYHLLKEDNSVQIYPSLGIKKQF